MHRKYEDAKKHFFLVGANLDKFENEIKTHPDMIKQIENNNVRFSFPEVLLTTIETMEIQFPSPEALSTRMEARLEKA